jgi:hypothetical protein
MGRRPSWELAEEPRFGVDLSDYLEPAADMIEVGVDDAAGEEAVATR